MKELLKRAVDYRKIQSKIWYVPIFCLWPVMMVLAYGLMYVLGAALPADPHVSLALVPIFFGVFLFSAFCEHRLDRRPDHDAVWRRAVRLEEKSALASLNDALRMELRPWGMDVCLVEPATNATPAAAKVQTASEALIAQLPRDGAQRYAGLFRSFTQRVVEREADGSPPEVVAAQLLRALTAARPKTRYLAGENATRLSLLAWLMPERPLDQLRLRIFGLPTAFGVLDTALAPDRTLKV